MRINKFYILVFICVILGITLWIDFAHFRTKTYTHQNTYLSNLQNGDLVLRRGKSVESYTVYIADDTSDFSHIGVIVMENQKPYVIHAVPNPSHFVLKESLEDFISSDNCSHYAVYRYEMPDENKNGISQLAQSFYEKKYRFDDRYDLSTDHELYCTELVYKVYQKAGIHLAVKPKPFDYVLGSHPVFLPSEFTKAPFKMIY